MISGRSKPNEKNPSGSRMLLKAFRLPVALRRRSALRKANSNAKTTHLQAKISQLIAKITHPQAKISQFMAK
jgi:hypothetical protein